ncbi:hypothetical protein CDAR_546381 [Caerostris darwini]|uniref:Uncharacterized protein n=1 Tax=Caerostris darwini TaxID=1538125 RepID=A0AAV4RP39_9ARAC|nr:hypothetical protein CDAR_546381 [Caerostris darwini]
MTLLSIKEITIITNYQEKVTLPSENIPSHKCPSENYSDPLDIAQGARESNYFAGRSLTSSEYTEIQKDFSNPLRILPSLEDSRKIISLCLDKKILTWKARNNNRAARRQIPGYERLYGTLKETGLVKY